MTVYCSKILFLLLKGMWRHFRVFKDFFWRNLGFLLKTTGTRGKAGHQGSLTPGVVCQPLLCVSIKEFLEARGPHSGRRGK